MKMLFWFANGDSVGTMYEVPEWGRVLVFDGILDLTQPFYFQDSEGNEINYVVNIVDILKEILPTMDTIKKAKGE